MDRLTMVTLNCTGLYVDRTDFIHEFICDNHVDILCLQETWLHETEFKYVKNISNDFLINDVSGIMK